MDIDPNELPYPGATIAFSRRSGFQQPVTMDDALTAGTAQWPTAYLRPGGRISDSEGVLCLTEAGVIFFADSGRDTAWGYEEIKRYSVKGSVTPKAKKLVFRGDGWTVRMRVNSQVADNADYILARKVPGQG